MVVDRVILRPRLSAPKEQNFLTEYFGSRVLVHEIPLPIKAGVELPGRTITSMGRQFELLVAEVKDDVAEVLVECRAAQAANSSHLPHPNKNKTNSNNNNTHDIYQSLRT